MCSVLWLWTIAAKSGFGEHEQMPPLTMQQQRQLVQLEHGVEAAEAEDILEVLRVGGDAEAEAALTPAQHARRWQILLGVLEREAYRRAGRDGRYARFIAQWLSVEVRSPPAPAGSPLPIVS